MFRYGFFALGLCLLLTSAFSQSASLIDSTSVLGLWSNAANPNEHFELRADGQFSLDENGQHHDGTWDLNGNTLTLHFSPNSVGTARWDGQAFVDDEQKRWVRATSTSPSAKQPPVVTSPSTDSTHDTGGDRKVSLQQALASQFKLAKITADGRDIVTAGSVLVLHKDGLLMYSIDTRVPPTSTYKDGKLSMGFGATFATNLALSQAQPGANVSTVPQRKFVTGEKFWILGYAVTNDGVTIKVYSDPYADVRYYGQLKFPFQKHTIPPTEDVLKTIAEVVTVQPEDNAAAKAAPQPPAQPAPAALALAPIPPPAPPADAPPAPPKTIAAGQTKDAVIATFGQPQKVVKLGTKEIYIYSDMKVTFVKGKVTDVQ